MGNLLFTIIGFVLGWGCEKVLDNIFCHVNHKYHIIKLRKKLKKRCTPKDSLTPNISVIAEGLPFFNISTQIQVKLSDEKFLLSASKELQQSLPATFVIHTEIDQWLDDCGIKEIEKNLHIERFEEILENCRTEVINSFKERKDGCYFNNTLFGVLYSDGFGRTPDEKESPVLTLKFFETDYFSHRVMWLMTNKLKERGSLPDGNLSINQLNDFFHCFRTSLGISIIIIIPDTNEIIMTKRSPNSAYGNGKEWVYVSVTETISETDFDDFLDNLNVTRWIQRALLEELGLKEEHYDTSSIHVYDMFFENFFYQDGLTASIKLRKGVDINMVNNLKAKDKQMEVKEIFSIDNTPSAIAAYISEHSLEMREQTIFTLQSYLSRNS